VGDLGSCFEQHPSGRVGLVRGRSSTRESSRLTPSPPEGLTVLLSKGRTCRLYEDPCAIGLAES
jgi:hypothetical protein